MSLGSFDLPPAPVVMGVLSLEVDANIEKALVQAEKILADGAALIDVSCAAHRDDLEKISVQEELKTLIPVIEIISKRISIPISVDTSNPEVMLAAVNAGAKMINDIRALTKLSAISTAAKLGTHVCLMHMHNDPVTMQLSVMETDIVSVVYKYLEQRIADCVAAGIDVKKIMIDPGFGYGKTLPQNLNLLRSLHVFKALNCPLVVDISHKSMIGQILDTIMEDREYGSLAAEVIAISRGADIIRSHDVRATVDAIRVIKAVAAG